MTTASPSSNGANANWDIRQMILYHTQMSGDHCLGDNVLLDTDNMYIALGHHNSFVVTPVPFPNNGEHPFETVLKSSIDVHKRADGSGSTMVIVALADRNNPITNCLDQNTKERSLKAFWDEDQPLLFCTLLHLPLDHSPIHEVMQDLLVWIQNVQDVSASCYWTIDCCDLVLFVKAKSYQKGTKAIFAFSEDEWSKARSHFLPVAYAYTVWGVQYCTVVPNFCCTWNEELKHVQIRATVQSMPSILGVLGQYLTGKKQHKGQTDGKIRV